MEKPSTRPQGWAAAVIIAALLSGCFGAKAQMDQPLEYKQAQVTQGPAITAPPPPESSDPPTGVTAADGYFWPEQIQVGDQMGSLTARSIKRGTSPVPYALVQFDGELRVTGTFVHYGKEIFFVPDESSLKRIPRISEGYGYTAYEHKRIPRPIILHWQSDKAEQVLVGLGEAVFSAYTVQYAPDADLDQAELVNGESVISLDGQQVSFSYGSEIRDEPVVASFRYMEAYHKLEGIADANVDSASGALLWNGLQVRREILSYPSGSSANNAIRSMIGNHVEAFSWEPVEAQGEDMYYVEVKRDAYDEAKGGYYGGFQYEYWLVVLREATHSDDFREPLKDAYVLSAVSAERELARGQGRDKLLKLAKSWVLPPKDFVLPLPNG